MALAGELAVVDACAAGRFDRGDHAAGAIDRDHVVLVTMEDPDGRVFEYFAILRVTTAAERHHGGKDLRILRRDVPRATAAHAAAGEVETIVIDGQMVREIRDEGEHVRGHLVLPANVARGALRREEEARLLLLRGLRGPVLRRAAELRLIVAAALARAVQPHDDRIALGGIEFGIAPDLVVQPLLGDTLRELARDLVRIRTFFEAGIAAFFAQQAAHVLLIGGGEFGERQLELIQIRAAADADLGFGKLHQLAFEGRFAVAGGPGARGKGRRGGVEGGGDKKEGEELLHGAAKCREGPPRQAVKVARPFDRTFTEPSSCVDAAGAACANLAVP